MKNKVTSFPLAFAPFAIIIAARALSKSFEKTTIVCPFSVVGIVGFVFAVPFLIIALIILFSLFNPINVLPVVWHHASISELKPLSVDKISISSPLSISLILSATFIIGPGHCRPQALIWVIFFDTALKTGSCLLRSIFAVLFFSKTLYNVIPPTKE